MSHAALQRVVVRMLHDPTLVDRVYEDAASALGDVEVEAHERAWLTRPDKRAWLTDPLRAQRALAALLDEFGVAGALAARTAGVPALAAFFRSRDFHEAVQARGSMALAFADYLSRRDVFADPRIAPCAAIERAVARARRAYPLGEDARGRLALAPDAAIARVPADALDLWILVSQALSDSGREPVDAVLHATLGLSGLPTPSGPEAALLVQGQGDPSVEVLPDGLAAVLEAARPPATREALIALIRAQGVESDAEAAEILDDVVSDGLLRVS